MFLRLEHAHRAAPRCASLMTTGEAVIMLTDNDKINGLPIRTEIRTPFDDGNVRWVSSVVICQDTDKGTFVVWSVWRGEGRVTAENGIYDIPTYERALQRAYVRAVS